MRFSNDVRFVVPNGWTKSYKPEGADNHVFILGITRGKAEITLFLRNVSDISYTLRDSRRFLWQASRYASTWNLPLYQWTTAQEWQIYQTSRGATGRFLISGASRHYEFFCSAIVEPPATDDYMLATIDDIFRSTIGVSGQPFARLTTKNLHLRSVSPPAKGDLWVTGDTTIHIPSGWIVFDMVLPSGFRTNSTYSTLELACRDYLTQEQHLNIDWMRHNVVNRNGNQRVAANWESRIKRWQMQPDNLTNPAPIQNHIPEVFVGVINDTHGISSHKKTLSPSWFYKSASLVLLAYGSMPDLGSLVSMQDTVAELIKQLSNQ